MTPDPTTVDVQIPENWFDVDPVELDLLDVTAGRHEATDDWTAVAVPGLDTDEQPVVVGSIATHHGGNTAGLRLQSVTSDGFEAFLEEERSKDREVDHELEAVRFFGAAEGRITDASGAVIGEAGIVDLGQPDGEHWHTVSLIERYDDPVVFAQVMSYRGEEPCHDRVRNVQSDAFEFRIEEWDYLDGAHVEEAIGYVVLERGTHELADGAPLEVATVAADHGWSDVTFEAAFAGDPAVVSRCQTFDGPDPVVTRQRNVDAGGVDVTLQEEEASGGHHVEETVGVLATPRRDVDVGFGRVRGVDDEWHGFQFESRTDVSPIALATTETFEGPDTASARLRQVGPTGGQVRIEEETSRDEETYHTEEAVSVVSLPSGRLWDQSDSLVGEAGSLDVSQPDPDHWHTLSFEERYDDPVAFLGLQTHVGDHPAHVRLRDVRGDGCEFQIEEWDYLDGSHFEETIGYLVVERGTHELPDGARLEVGRTRSDHTWGNAVGFDADFGSSQPAILAQAQSRAGTNAIVTRVRNLDAHGVQVRLQEEEGRDGTHVDESVGYLAIARPGRAVPDYQITRALDARAGAFTPETCGFYFPNSFTGSYTLKKSIGPIDEIGDASNGMCGGMVFAARDYFEHDRSPWPEDLTDRSPPNSPVSSEPPAEDTALFDFLSERLFDSFEPSSGNVLGAGLYQTLMNSANVKKWYQVKKSRNEVMRDHWEDTIRPTLENGTPCPLGLIHVDTHGKPFKTGLNRIGENHQVLAYGYRREGDVIEIFVYDPNYPKDDAMKVQFTKKDSLKNWFEPTYVGSSKPLYAFFSVSYSPMSPPTF